MTTNIENLVAELARDAAVVKPAPHPYLLSLKWLAAAAVYLAISLWLTGLRPDLAQAFEQPWLMAETLALVLILVATAVSAALLSFPDLHQRRGVAMAPAWLFLLFVVVMFMAWRADTPPAPLPEHTFECTLCILLVALPPIAWVLYTMRRFASTHYGLAGSLAVLFAFSVGALWLRLHEVNDSIVHVVAWHYLPMLAAGAIGLWLGRRLLRW
jgi:hypothetical protein